MVDRRHSFEVAGTVVHSAGYIVPKKVHGQECVWASRARQCDVPEVLAEED